MAIPFHRLLWLPLIAAAAMLACWMLGKPLDRFAFTQLARGTANPPFFFGGSGTHKDPWTLRTLSRTVRADKNLAPVIVSLADDTDGFFQSSPHSAVDLAVVLSNFHRLGAKQAACSVMLEWDTPDPIGLLALEIELGKFDSLVTAAPLTRGAVPSSIPPSFRNASIPISDVRGDVGALPTVNRIAVPGVILGGERALSGFTHLDSESPTAFPQIIARWDDRLVFSFHFLAALQRMGVRLQQVEILPGQYLKLGDSGKIMLIDHFGRLPVDLADLPARHEFDAEALIDTDVNSISTSLISIPWIFRDDRSAMEPALRDFSTTLIPAVASIASEAGLSKTVAKKRPDPRIEFILLGNIWFILLVITRLSDFRRNICFLLLAGLCIAGQFIASGFFSIWMPGTIALSGISAAWLASLFVHTPQPKPVSPTPPASEPPAPAPVKPARKAAKKAVTKKTAAKKVAAKKTAAKKTASPRKPKSSS